MNIIFSQNQSRFLMNEKIGKNNMSLIVQKLKNEAARSVLAALIGGCVLSGGSVAFAESLQNGSLDRCRIELCDENFSDENLSEEGQVRNLAVGHNTETADLGMDEAANDLGISVSVDGEAIIGNADKADAQRIEDVDLDSVDIQIKFDGLEVEPRLNVSTVDMGQTYEPGQKIEFLASTNYPDWIEQAEVIIYNRADLAKTPIASLPVKPNGKTSWKMPETVNDRIAGYHGDASQYMYVLRVYDAKGRFDETGPLVLKASSRANDTASFDSNEEPVSPGNGEDRASIRNIPVYGGAVTVFGSNIPSGYRVDAFGETVPIDNDHKFVTQRILPPGDHAVNVDVKGEKDGTLAFQREINIPSSEWFYVGLADITVGKRWGDGEVVSTESGDDYDKEYSKGRVAFYLKGKIKGQYLLTAAADTKENELSDLFSNLDSKSSRQLLRRIDPNKYYPVYGDDSTIVEDAPTSGKFYVRLDKGDSHVMWGNFKSQIKGSEFIRNERTLYGASAVYKSESTTSFGEHKVEVTGYAAQPDTLPQRDVFRGTGGSTYFLKRQDISIGSETISIEVRDPVSSRVLDRRELVYGEDYEIDYFQGIIILKNPLFSTASGSGLVRDGALGDNEVRLIAQYEYVPTFDDADGNSYGGRAQAWLGDGIRIGATAMSEDTGTFLRDADQTIMGADIVLRASPTTFLRAEYARTDGPGFGNTYSVDGGLLIGEIDSTGFRNRQANAWKVKGQVDLNDLYGGSVKGTIGGYYENKEAGFSTLDDNIDVDQRIWGAFANIVVSEDLLVDLTYDVYDDDDGRSSTEIEADAEWKIDSQWRFSAGVKYSDIDGDTRWTDRDEGTGGRTDLAARLTYVHDERQQYYIFGQVTLDTDNDRNRNDRGGVGARLKLTEKVGLDAEVSYGTSGIGALAALTYDPTANDHYYMGYRLSQDNAVPGSSTSTDLSGGDGGLVFGSKRRHDDHWQSYSENNVDLYGEERSLTSTYGVTYTPDAAWTVTGGLEVGQVLDSRSPAFDRHAVSLGANYKEGENFQARIRAEYRRDDSDDDDRDLDAFLIAAGFSYKVNPDWRMIANVDAAISNSDSSSLYDGDYIEGALGFAYRPILNDRFNALVKYTYLEDLPGQDQITWEGEDFGPRQKSHVFSADGAYDVNRILTVGAKYGFRIGEVEWERSSGDYEDSSAHLAVIRADMQIAQKWDLLLEGRTLWSPSADTTKTGVLAAGYYDVGNNLKVGVGYNFADFSDDLTDLTYDDEGVFLNVVGKF